MSGNQKGALAVMGSGVIICIGATVIREYRLRHGKHGSDAIEDRNKFLPVGVVGFIIMIAGLILLYYSEHSK